ncbi:MAG: TAT-variant-translocated molybdopterin oxidoreductase [Verrucomicrobia bacterium]|nr:TAT-variant-translocated molybdopterin oxidoreductase [Verrucomicrobiota bacterium]
MPASPTTSNFSSMRARLAQGDGPTFWRSLEDLARTPEFEEMLHREFPAQASEWIEGDGTSRRNFLKLMGASLAFAGLSACTRQPQETILPYVRQPQEITPGIPLQFATAMPHFHGFARGVLVESHEGRPTKIEGNPDHPASLGATDVFMQAAILDLYDPDRSRNVLRAGEISSYDLFYTELTALLAAQDAKAGAGLRILTETVTSPTLGAQLDALLKKYPRAKWHQYEPLTRDHVRDGARQAFGDFLETHHDFSKARVIVALDSDFLFAHANSLRYAREFTNGRRVAEAAEPGAATMNRLYVVEPTPTITGASADHRLPLAADEIAAFARDLLALSGEVVDYKVAGNYAAWLHALAADLGAARGASIVLAGERQPAAVHALAHAINAALGNVGQTVFYAPSAEYRPARQMDSLRELVGDLQAGAVETLVIVGGNPVYTAPADVPFADALKKAGRVIHHGLHFDETARYAHWHIPAAHFLENWNDLRAFDGTVSVAQPLIDPLYKDARNAVEFLESLLTAPVHKSYDILRDRWRAQRPELADADFEKWWRRTIHDGVMADSALPRSNAAPATTSTAAAAPTPAAVSTANYEICFAPDPSIWDGRFANNGWLQETPKPISKLTWDNAAFVSPKLAEKLGLNSEDIVELKLGGRTLRAPVWIQPGQAERSVTLHFGYGRSGAGNVGTGQGCNAFALRAGDAGFAAGLEIRKVPGEHWDLAVTQRHHALEGRDVVRGGALADFLKEHAAPARGHEPEPGPDDTLYPDDHTYPVFRWGMTVDLTTCIGCNACIVACQSENNIPIVGKGEVRREREMHWLRVDSYFSGTNLDAPEIVHQPVPCMQCENAPCEVVCPVAATVHDPDGLNAMVYNRCVGTRYCSNNCPYKVRRFNFFQWPDQHTLTYKLQRNPEVTVRSRGVMEKCTYCVQRISRVKIDSERENRRPRDGEIQTACQQACPTEAIIFGDLNDPASRVNKIKKSPLNYGMLAELNTRPRTTYIARLKNPNPAMTT